MTKQCNSCPWKDLEKNQGFFGIVVKSHGHRNTVNHRCHKFPIPGEEAPITVRQQLALGNYEDETRCAGAAKLQSKIDEGNQIPKTIEELIAIMK